ncbi:MAG: DUF86 domain-containing protein [Clostridiales bacterium]|jgi:uncharacterized protein with HEPN domain|nr:DUF86 domain-containing protein [Clostridiales bacterium]MDR2713548.1 DUF86 domain-containing protein [Clostridiales bacterium]
MSIKDSDILRHILRYCEQIQETQKEFESSRTKFMESSTFHNAVCLCLLQIGELVTGLSEEFISDHPEIQWREIKLLRNIVAHHYGHIDYDIIWDICLTDIPEMMYFCINAIAEFTTKRDN